MKQQDDLNVDSLWLFDERDKSGKHANVYHGNFIPQIPRQLLGRYTHEGDTVLELFSGSGTTLFECESMHRNYIGFDLNAEIIAYVREKMVGCDSILFDINECDVTDHALFSDVIKPCLARHRIETADFLIAHPPYMDIVKFTQHENDLSQISDISIFIPKFVEAISNGFRYLGKGKYFALVAGDVYKNSEVVPLAFKMMEAVQQHFDVKLKGIVVKNIEGNKGKLGKQDIWRSRAMRSDYFLFKHEYIFVFKKMV